MIVMHVCMQIAPLLIAVKALRGTGSEHQYASVGGATRHTVSVIHYAEGGANEVYY